MVSEMSHTSQDKLIQLLEEQLAFTKEQNKQLTNQIELLTAQVRQLTKMIYGSRSEKSKYQKPDERQGSLFNDEPSFNKSEQTEEQSTESVTYTVTRSNKKKKCNDSFLEGVEVEEIHHR